MRIPKPIINGGEQWLALAEQRFRALKAIAGPLRTSTQYIYPDTDTTIEVHVSPAVDRIKIDSAPGLEVSSGLVNIGIVSPATEPPTPRKFSRFYPGSIQAAPDKRAWVDTAKLNYRRAEGEPAQAAAIRSTMFTGAMERVVSVALGANQPIPWSWKWDKTHGVHFDLVGKPWLIEVSASNGVLAMKFPKTKAIKPKATEAAIQKSLGFLPGFSSFPTDADKLDKAIADGVVRRLATVEDLQDFYSKQSMRDHIGWAFNPDGSECQNIAIGFMDASTGSFRFKIQFSTSENGPTAAVLTLQDSGKGYGIRKYSGYVDGDGVAVSRYCDGTRLFFGSPDAAGNNFSRDDEFSFGELGLNEVAGTEQDPYRCPVFVFYDDEGVEQVFYQDIYAIDGPRYSGQPAHDFFQGSESLPGAVYLCDFSGPGIPSHQASEIIEPAVEETTVLLGQSEPFSVLDNQTPPQVDPSYARFAGYSPGPGDFEATVGVYAIIQKGIQPSPKLFSSNSIYIAPQNRSGVFVLNNKPSFTPQVVAPNYVIPASIFDGVASLWGPSYPPQGQGIYPKGSVAGPNAASSEANSAYLQLRASVGESASFQPKYSASASLIYVGPNGVSTHDVSAWVDYLKTRSSGWRGSFTGLSGIVPQWIEKFFAGFFIDFAAAVPLAYETSPSYPTGFYAASGRSAFLKSSFHTKTPSPHIPASTMALDALDGEPLTTAQPVAINAQTIPLMLGWVGYS